MGGYNALTIEEYAALSREAYSALTTEGGAASPSTGGYSGLSLEDYAALTLEGYSALTTEGGAASPSTGGYSGLSLEDYAALTLEGYSALSLEGASVQYTYERVITIAGTTEVLLNFAVPIRFSGDTGLTEHCRSDGNDVRFTDMSGAALLFEKSSYSAGTGIWWVLIPSLPTAGISIKMTYGDASLSTDASSRNVWAGHAAVLHLDGDAHDSGPEARTLTSYGTPTFSNGMFGKVYNSPKGSYFNLGTESDSNGMQAFSYWVKYTSAASTQSVVFESKYHYNDVCNGYIRHAWNWHGTSISANVWHYVYFFSQPDAAQIVIDGVNYGMTGGKSGINATQTFLGGYYGGYSDNPDGIQIAEFRWTNRYFTGTAGTARNLHNYHLGISPSSYITYGEETQVEAASRVFYPWIYRRHNQG